MSCIKKKNHLLHRCMVRMWFTTNSYSGCILQVKWLNKQLGKLWPFVAEVRFLFLFILIIFFCLQLGVIGKKFQVHFGFL
jgi:hypothetical protein